jgi:rhodanese-related sulfurtransferase
MIEEPGIDLSPGVVAERMEEDLLLVDVREPYEWRAGHVPGSVHIEMSAIGERLDELPADRPTAFICRSGARSGMVARTLRARGYDAYNVDGGFLDWFDASLPTEPENAEVASH